MTSENNQNGSNRMGVVLQAESEVAELPSALGDNKYKRSHRRSFFGWLAKQSLPRFLGLLFGDTRALEARIADKDKEIEWLRSSLEGKRLSDDLTLAMMPALPKSSSQPPITTFPKNSMEIIVEVDKLTELLHYDPRELEERLVDLQSENTPKAKEILRRFGTWFDALPVESKSTVEEDGVLIR